jgi:prepilin-type N-terminal cleavage/methylation domain-containing protein
MPFRNPHSAFRIRSAFTLIELIAAALVLGIMTAAAVPTFVSSIMYHRAESAAVRVKRDLELARQMAITRSTSYSVEFSASVYKIPNLDSLDHAGQDYEVDLSRAPHSVQVNLVDFGGASSVTFNGYGTPSASGTIVLQAGSHQRQIDLNDQGHVVISK